MPFQMQMFYQVQVDMDVLQEAGSLIDGDRQETYGDPALMWDKVAKAWSLVFGVDVTPEQAVLAMVMLKAVRQTTRHHRDNLVDLAAYAEILSRIRAKNDKTKTVSHN